MNDTGTSYTRVVNGFEYRRVLPDTPSAAYVVVNGRDGRWHIVDRSGVSRLVRPPGTSAEVRHPGDGYHAMILSALRRWISSPGRTFVAIRHEQLEEFGFMVW